MLHSADSYLSTAVVLLYHPGAGLLRVVYYHFATVEMAGLTNQCYKIVFQHVYFYNAHYMHYIGTKAMW